MTVTAGSVLVSEGKERRHINPELTERLPFKVRHENFQTGDRAGVTELGDRLDGGGLPGGSEWLHQGGDRILQMVLSLG